MLKILQILFSIIAVCLAGYSLLTKDFQFHGYMILSIGISILLLGIQELKRNNLLIGWIQIGLFGFLIFVAIQVFLYFP